MTFNLGKISTMAIMLRLFSSRGAMSLAVATFVSFSAVAQSGSNQAKKEFQFEVFSIRPMPLGQEVGLQGSSKPSPNGYSTRVTLWQAVVIAYAPPGPPATAWTSVKMRNDPGWFAEYYDTR
jgi:hypothetical protein